MISILTEATNPPDTTAKLIVVLSALGAVLGTISTILGVLLSARARKRELDTEAHKVTRDEFKDLNESLGSLTDRWETQAREAWEEIERLKEGRMQDQATIVALRQRMMELESELAEERRENTKLRARIARLEENPS